MQLHDCANFGLMNPKQAKKNGTVFMYLSQFDKVSLVSDVLMSFLMPSYAQNFQAEHFDCSKEFDRCAIRLLTLSAFNIWLDYYYYWLKQHSIYCQVESLKHYFGYAFQILGNVTTPFFFQI